MGQLIATADFEGDGDADLFTSTGVFLNTGGFFRPGPTLSLGFLLNVRSIAIADLTGDGRIDVLVGHVSGPQLYAAPPAGGGTFLLIANAFPGATSLSELCVADVDGDGDFDVFAAQSSTATTQWRLFLNNGTGGFTAAPLSQWAAATISPSWVGAGDFDGDGLIDAIATGYLIGTVWRRNLGGGTFGPSIVLGSSLLADDGAIGDFDGDGDDDVFVVAVDGMEAIHTGSPAGLVQGASVFGGILATPPFAADINGDQTIDLLRSIVPVSGGTHADVVLRMGSPAGLGPAIPYRTVRFGIGNPAPFRGIALLDVQGDSGRDLAFVPGGEAPSLLIADGAFGYVAAPKAVPPACGPLWVPLRDVNGDGAPDLLRADIVNGQLNLTSHHNDGRGNFAATPTPAGAISSLASGVPSWFDLDNDGDQDLWLRQLSGSHLTLTNDGTGVFSASTAIGGVHPTASVAFGDFDGDFDIDVVVGRSINHLNPFVLQPPVIHFGQATPSGMTYTPAATFGLAEVIVDFVVFDADFDLDLDLLAVTNGGIPRLYQNDGFGGFTLVPSPAVPTTTVAVGDVNNDGLPDLVLGNQTWLHNVTSWTFAATHAAPIGRISLADVDGDGDLDLLDAAGLWYEGNGTGAFAAPIAFVPYQATAQLSPATNVAQAIDVDNDGDLDLLGPHSGYGSPTIYSNLTRHAARTSLMSQGTTTSMAVFGPPTTPWFLGVSLPATVGLPLPPFGVLFLDPASLVVGAAGVTGATGRSDVPFAIPANPGLAGYTLSWQALMTNGLTNGFDMIVLP